MITEKFKGLIERETDRVQSVNALLAGARQGKINKNQMEKYLHNLMYFFRHTPIHLDRARRRAEKAGYAKLAEFFDEKIREEKGHEFWAKDDLKSIGCGVGDVDLSQITAGTERLLAYAKDIIDHNPNLFIPYMLFLEYFTVLAAPAFLKDLEEKCGIPMKAVTAIGKHAELDKDHVKEDLSVLEIAAKDCAPHELEEALYGTVRYLEQMIEQCTQIH